MTKYPFVYFFSLLLSMTILTQCKNVIGDMDGIGDGVPFQFEDQQYDIGQGEVYLLRVKEWAEFTDNLSIQILNSEAFTNRLRFTSDGLLAYWAPFANRSEDIRLQLEDDAGNTGMGLIEMDVDEDTVLEECSDDYVINVGAMVSQTEIFDIVGDDKLCIGFPQPHQFEIIFEPKEMQYEIVDENILVQPLPGGIGTDYLVYKSFTSTPESEYLEVVKIVNETGCHEKGLADNISVSFDASMEFYELKVLDNDEFCTFTQQDAGIIEVSGTTFGTTEIVNNQFINYSIEGSPSLPLVENFSYVATYQTKFGKVEYTTDVQLIINP